MTLFGFRDIWTFVLKSIFLVRISMENVSFFLFLDITVQPANAFTGTLSLQAASMICIGCECSINLTRSLRVPFISTRNFPLFASQKTHSSQINRNELLCHDQIEECSIVNKINDERMHHFELDKH